MFAFFLLLIGSQSAAQFDSYCLYDTVLRGNYVANGAVLTDSVTSGPRSCPTLLASNAFLKLVQTRVLI